MPSVQRRHGTVKDGLLRRNGVAIVAAKADIPRHPSAALCTVNETYVCLMVDGDVAKMSI